jgi:hypothetical protein
VSSGGIVLEVTPSTTSLATLVSTLKLKSLKSYKGLSLEEKLECVGMSGCSFYSVFPLSC